MPTRFFHGPPPPPISVSVPEHCTICNCHVGVSRDLPYPNLPYNMVCVTLPVALITCSSQYTFPMGVGEVLVVQYNPCRTTTLTNDHPSHTTTFRVTDRAFCLCTNPSRAPIPLIRPHQCDAEVGRIRGVLLYVIIVIIITAATYVFFVISRTPKLMLLTTPYLDCIHSK